MSRFKAVLRRKADDEVQTFRELNTDVEQIIREQNSGRREERRAEVTQEELIHGQEINVTHKKSARTRRALRFVCTAIDELEVFPSTSPPSSATSNGRNMPGLRSS